ncbi:nucleotidyltransferase family protein [Caldivirga maquilingensis]|uniref:UTP--glucose-1-phosphate uridylyltransferase n=1 Tax=Caldivirga maquilingensis (strain ATCC 700844 / DSM 13496 / JCM 10307 / IC-167) TaxID=397948 RepID=A8M9M9_CALMQ|nr:nucleotidyltransferase family protein [Caldivirga maquilingensis]ABW00910.1 Nucleotidyl transferase [Caldivirga maquilingensis IC-167]
MNIGAVVTAAGLGTRDGPWTLIFPKALLPLVVKINGITHIRPMLDLIITTLTRVGCSKICITRRSDDDAIVKYTKALWGTFNVDFTIQDEPRGFGDAVYRGLGCLNNVDWVIVHSDDGFMINESSILMNSIKFAADSNIDGLVFVRRVNDPSRYGVLQGFVEEGTGLYRVTEIEEKPKVPKSNLALTAVYLFKYSILTETLRKIEDEGRPIIEFTDAIKQMVQGKAKVMAMEVGPKTWFSIGTPSEYTVVHEIVRDRDLLEII